MESKVCSNCSVRLLEEMTDEKDTSFTDCFGDGFSACH